MAKPTVDQWGGVWLPRRPYATDTLAEGITRMPRERALERRYLEANPSALVSLLVVDIDHDDAVFRAIFERDGILPTCTMENPANGHAHACWALQEPVCRVEYAHRAPLALAAAVSEGLRRSVDGDPAYSGLITKNPLSDTWNGQWWTDKLWQLTELAAALDASGWMPPPSWRRTQRKAPTGLGRNSTIFATARYWAYREMRHHWGDATGLGQAILERVLELNAGFSEPLPASEARAIARSITRWITTRSRMWADGPAVYEATFSTIQSARRKRACRATRLQEVYRDQ